MNNNLRISHKSTTTLVDMVEGKLIQYFKENDLKVGDPIPREVELAQELGVARTVLREALSRFRMLGLIETRTKRGMILSEPDILGGIERAADPRFISRKQMLEILGMRVIIEIGMGDFIIQNKTDKDIKELEEIVDRETLLENNKLTVEEESRFHYKLYEMTRNETIVRMFNIFSPVFIFIKENFADIIITYKKSEKKNNYRVTHKDIVNIIKKNDAGILREALKNHLELYFHLLKVENNKRIGIAESF